MCAGNDLTYLTCSVSASLNRVIHPPILQQGLDTVNQGIILAGMYRFLVSDFANPAALEGGGAGGGVAYVYIFHPFSCISLASYLD